MRSRRHARHCPDRPPLWSRRGLLRAAGDPLVQSWGMVMLCFMVALVHYAGRTAGREQKNNRSSSPLFVAGFSRPGNSNWLDKLPAPESGRPGIVLAAAPVSRKPSNAVSSLPALAAGVSAARERAANAGDWHHLTAGLRSRISAARNPASAPCRVEIISSGTVRGNAEAITWHQARVEGGAESAPDFVIGNGTRSGNGEIEMIENRQPVAGEVLRICLIGTDVPTRAQENAAGELLAWLEARCGALPVTDPVR